jgi:hypothetical protein
MCSLGDYFRHYSTDRPIYPSFNDRSTTSNYLPNIYEIYLNSSSNNFEMPGTKSSNNDRLRDVINSQFAEPRTSPEDGSCLASETLQFNNN